MECHQFRSIKAETVSPCPENGSKVVSSPLQNCRKKLLYRKTMVKQKLALDEHGRSCFFTAEGEVAKCIGTEQRTLDHPKKSTNRISARPYTRT